MQKGDLPTDQSPFIEAIEGENMRLPDYLHAVYHGVRSFKSYKKDYVGRELLKNKVVNRWLWIFNWYVVADKGLKEWVNQRVHAMEQIVKKLIRDHSKNGRGIEELKEDVLLVDEFERKIDEIHNKFVMDNRSDMLANSSLSPLFVSGFSFDHFNRKLSTAYKISSKSWDWEDTDEY